MPFNIEEQPNGKFRIRGIPIFQTHTDAGWKCDAAWMQRVVAKQQAWKAGGFLPRLIPNHTPDQRTAKDENKPVGFLDNYSFNPADGRLYADYVDVDAPTAAEIKDNKWPGRSVEVRTKDAEIPVVALLGSATPYFKFPDLRFQSAKVEGDMKFYADADKAPDFLYAMGNDMNSGHDASGDLTSQANNVLTPEEQADFAKFSRYMQMYEAQKSKANPEKPGEKTEKKPEEKDTKPDQEPEKEKEEYMDANLATKYADLEGKVTKYATDLATLRTENAVLQTKIETGEWTAKYAAQRIPATRLDVAEQVAFTMSLPAESRQKYFDGIVKAVKGPAPATDGTRKDAAPPVERGTEAEAKAVAKYHTEQKAKGRAINYMDAAKEYRASSAA